MRYRVIYLGGLAGKGHGIEKPHHYCHCCSISCTRDHLFLTRFPCCRSTEAVSEGAMPATNLSMGERERLDELITLLDKMKNDIRVFRVPATQRGSR